MNRRIFIRIKKARFNPQPLSFKGKPNMVRNETKFMECAIALSEELNFTRAAQKIHVSQPMLTKTKTVALNDAGRAYVEQARLALLYSERAFQVAKAAMHNADVLLNIGRSPYTDPFLVSTLLSIQLSLFPQLKIELENALCSSVVFSLLSVL